MHVFNNKKKIDDFNMIIFYLIVIQKRLIIN